MCNDENFRLVVASFTIIGTLTRDVPNKRTKRDRSESKPLEPTSLYYFYYFFFRIHIAHSSLWTTIRLKLINTAESLIGSAGILCCSAARPTDIAAYLHGYNTHTHARVHTKTLHKACVGT